MEQILSALRDNLDKACKKCDSNTIALSGGLDSTILAYLLQEKKPNAISVVAKDFAGTDLIYSQIAAKEFDLPLKIIKPETSKILESVERTISILKNFNNIEIRNNIVMFLVINEARKNGVKSIVTGDGADELFAGYNFLLNKSESELKKELNRIFSIMHFPSHEIGKSLGVKVNSPYLEENFKKFACEIPPNLKVNYEAGTKFGKWVLRKAFEGKITNKIIWRDKAPMQDGSGTNQLSEMFDRIISDESFLNKKEKIEKEFNVTLRSKESMYYFEIFINLFDLSQSSDKEDSCPFCHHSVKNSKFCRMCGAYPI